MGHSVIEIVNLGKEYHIGGETESYGTLRDTLAAGLKSPFRKAKQLLGGHSTAAANLNESFWALENINFSIKAGEVLGIIGRNGAGKSTLLKVLSSITEPSTGHVDIYGRVGSLLEVGTGFHPELTGRENVFLNGAILGMSREEIAEKFNEIVAFAEVEQFIDTPVKHYSSGMALRLGFAVAAHLEPEILVVDEVLAVGDIGFQRKCLGKMNDVARSGRTILFVSHQMNAIQGLCERVIVLESGNVVFDGETDAGIQRYLSSYQQEEVDTPLSHRQDRQGDGRLRLRGISFIDAKSKQKLYTILSGQCVDVDIEYECFSDKPVNDVQVSIGFWSLTGQFLFACSNDAIDSLFENISGQGVFTCRIPQWPLPSGLYTYNIIININGLLTDWIKQAGTIEVITGDFYGTGRIPARAHKGVFVHYEWF